ncbi:MAG TPA: pyridoxal 5'-phosphate synthase glutaminase subunit PdxT [Acidimicrobiales bacterium]|nr:pyridoxal 5'-phosphate synthase glutaminase subunit PdxT [Acidimicrobiales bacterium]
MTIGVLALQGDVREHAAALADLGELARLVRRPSDLDGLAGIVLPGGESTTLSLLLESSGLFEPLAEALGSGLPVLGTCAGMILLASDVLDGRPDQRRFSLIELTVRRNGYGRQQASFECDLDVDLDGAAGEPFHAVFIRAPVVEAYGPDVEVLAALPALPAPLVVRDGPAVPDPDGPGGAPSPVICRQGSVLVAAFHPELTEDRRLHRLFVDMTKEERR